MVTVNCPTHGITLGTYNNDPAKRECVKCKDERDMAEALERFRRSEGADMAPYYDPDQGDLFDAGWLNLDD